MISSPPQEAEHIRGKTLTPESPKPVHYPSPSNIPILEKQMDPMFNEPAPSIGTPASFQSYSQQTQTPSAQTPTSYYAEQQAPAGYQTMAAPGTAGAAAAGFNQPTAYGGGGQDTSSSIHNFSSQMQAPASSYSEAKSAPVQESRIAYPLSYDPNAYATSQTQAQPPHGGHYQTPTNAGGGVDFQALLENLSSANSGATDRYVPSQLPPQPSQSLGQTPVSSLPAAPNLPPRPPPQEKPSTHPNYNPNDDIRSYHPHSQKQPNFRGQGQLQPLNVRAGSGNPQLDNPSATRSNHSPSTPGYGHRRSVDRRSESPDDENSRWPPEINTLYEEFLDDERRFVTDGQWDQFPMGSRLFIGNLPTEKVTKRDIFHRFFRHGKLAQISIKQAYGFVQFMDSASCHKALQAEQGSAVRGRKMHLEVSKPQRNTKKADHSNNERNSGARRRSRSPDYSRGGTGPQPRHVDRYSGSQNATSPRDRESRRFRDDYRSARSPSPPRGGRGSRGRDRSWDRYDGRRRSRSRSPRRYRSRSPRDGLDDDLPLPFRAPNQIPDVQVLVIDEGVPRDFIRWVEDSFKQQGLRIDVLILSPRLSEAAVIRRQIVEGVSAIVKLDTAALSKSKVSLQLFDRRGGAGNVTFNEYADLEPNTAAALVTHAKQTSAQPVQQAAPTYNQSYGIPSNSASTYGGALPQSSQYSPAATSNAPQTLSSMISALDSNGLSQLLGAIQGNTPAPASQPAPTGITPDLARLLGSVSSPTQHPSYAVGAQPPSQTYNSAYQNSALASLLSSQSRLQPPGPGGPPGQTQTQSSPSGQPDMNEIMAQLAKYQR